MNIAKLAGQYIENHPSVKDCVKKRLVNYSQLSRRILKENSLKSSNFDAVLIACRRYYWKISKSGILEDKITGILSKSRIEVKNRMAVAVLYKDVFSEDLILIEKKAKKCGQVFYAVEGTEAITLVISEELLAEVKNTFKSGLKTSWKSLALVILKSPEGVQDTTPGFLSFLTGKISQQGINILEIMSCWSETLFVVSENDIAKVLEAFRFQ